jgi:formylglycine-generating enzyme required for sulfatase activity
MKYSAFWVIILTACLHAFAQNCPVVDFGDDLCWYSGYAIPPYRNNNAAGLKLTTANLSNGNWRIGHPFSLDVPLNCNSGEYNRRGNNAIFYGGMMTLVYNSPDAKDHWTEGGINVNHDGFDDLNYMGFGLKSTNNFMRAFGVWLWKKENFLNGGDQYPVTFDENSRVAVFLSRTYPVDKFTDTYAMTRTNDVPRQLWKGWEDVELVVQDGDQFYIAQTDFRPKQWTLFEVSPARVKWAKWNPQEPWDFEWDRKTAVFAEHTFKDVRAAGWMIAKPTAEIATFWLKWYAFGMDAVVDRPSAPGWTLPLVSFGNDGLHIAKDLVTYDQWIKVYKWASRNQYCLHHGYNFSQDGNPGTAQLDDKTHRTDEPVTGITWQDAVLWCNALSEYEGKTPCYYGDAAFTKVLRSVKNRTGIETVGKLPEVYLKEDAGGYRLPTAAEWSSPVSENALWSFIWDVNGNQFDPGKDTAHTVIGGTEKAGQLAAGEIPSRGHYAISFRPVLGNGKDVSFGKTSGVSTWTFTEEEIIKPGTSPDVKNLLPGIPLIEVGDLLAGKTEITYAQWRTVFNWAEVNGYRFDHDGDMGSLKWDNKTETHSFAEPVTAIGALDAAVWCNALSEMSGLKPCYYADKELTQVLRTVHPARVIALPNRLTIYYTKPVQYAKLFEKLWFVDQASDGFRLPVNVEWTRIAGGDPATGSGRDMCRPGGYPSGAVLDPATTWYIENSGERTHPSGQTQPTGAGFHDLAGNVFEWVLEPQKNGTWQSECRGGSHRSENRSSTTPSLNNKFVARYSIGGGLSSGLANDEIGFRVVRNKTR